MGDKEKFSIKNEKEQRMYDVAGGGELGEQVVMRYREYIKDHRKWLSDEMRRVKRESYSAVKESDKGTSSLYTKIDD